jgi:hypothetical protein
MGLEYCSNGELYTQLQERGPLPVPDVVHYAAEIVDILAYLRQALCSWRRREEEVFWQKSFKAVGCWSWQQHCVSDVSDCSWQLSLCADCMDMIDISGGRCTSAGH